MNIPMSNEIYKHFKGNLYKILTIAIDSETEEKVVVYQALYGNYDTYVRKLDDFTAELDKEKYPDASQKYRFEPVDALNGTSQTEPVNPVVSDTTVGAVGEAGVASKDSGAGNQNAAVGNADVDENADEIGSPDSKDISGMTEEGPEGEVKLNPLVERYLDSDSIEDRIDILVSLRHRCTTNDISIMATVMDIEIDDTLDVEEQYRQLFNCVSTRGRYETNRLR
ncbi:MAG: DUF1653 domain-containing protein [Lachnospiraceae bacterium]|nr:DUF1653 domain-containing protein [Lachnospiraceae bacterium]